MSFDTQTRNRLASFVGKCRALLCGDFKSPGGEMARQLAHYGIQDTGTFFEVDTLTHLDEPGRETARTLRSILAHKQASAPAAKVWKKFDAAVYDLIQEQGFTVLNRLCALRMAEERKILEFPCISKGLQSDGFELYEYHTGKANAAISKEDRFQHFVFSLFDELSLDLGSLFDRFSPQGLLFPAPQALGELLALINDPALAHLWAEDETIGWIYQYWNSKEERKAMRDASAAPRNSRELAVRNQFFTPRYVVQFLTDNTLGRIWYEMTQGRTGLVDQCEYLVRRPNEIFLGEGESAPEVPSDQLAVISEEGMSQEELLKQPVYIPFRPLKDPREIRLLDPACGSMHFGLYAFDLFEKIYSEFWDLTIAEGGEKSSTDHCSLITSHSLQPLPDRYASKDEYMRDVPKMIIEHNIHGIDIDPRAAQIAGLALWLRAQRSWQSAGLLATQRPKVERSNIVCAEPMPGDKEQLAEFTAKLHPAIARMVETIFEKMQLAGEAGSLLKIEEEITTLVDNAKAAWKQIGKHEGEMFSAAELVNADRRAGTQTQLDIGSWNLETLSAISDSDFFEQAEQSIYQALARYAESATQGSYKRKLFAHDAAQGFAFIDLCRKRYEAVVMNPPFGDTSGSCYKDLKSQYPESTGNIYPMFVKRGAELSPSGALGAITARTFLALTSFKHYRKSLLSDDQHLVCLVDLGWDVLDQAQVETCCFVMQGGDANSKILFLDLLDLESSAKEDQLAIELRALQNDADSNRRFDLPIESIKNIPQQSFSYRLTPQILAQYAKGQIADGRLYSVFEGAAMSGAEQYIHLWHEVASESLANRWLPLAHGGKYCPFYRPIVTVVDWEDDGYRPKAEITSRYPYLKGNYGLKIKHEDKYHRSGLSYGKRTDALNVSVMPRGCIFSHEAQAVFPSNLPDDWLFCLGLLNSRSIRYCANQIAGVHKLAPYVARLPFSESFRASLSPHLAGIQENVELMQKIARLGETNREFVLPLLLTEHSASLRQVLHKFFHNQIEEEERCISSEIEINLALESILAPGSSIELIQRDMGFLPGESASQLETPSLAEISSALADDLRAPYYLQRVSRSLGCSLSEAKQLLDGIDPANSSILAEECSPLISFFVGSSFARWDIRYATGERQAPELPDPFDPLPVCPPGMLQNESGLPLSIAELTELNAEGSYPLRVSIDGILVDDAGHASEDIVARVRDALAVIWGERSGAIEQEACDILKVKELRDYFSEGKSGGKFFKDHLKRYSKSRRKAPIYWPISTESGGYTLWFYYHRLTEDSLYTAVTQFIVPRQEEAAATFARLGAKQERSKAEDKELESAQTLVAELATLKDSLLEIAKFWKPNLNDGVQITAAPLWKHFRLGTWQKVLKDTWGKLQKGEYDWAHLAHSTWPERVIPKCTTDRSLAIAHGHEQALWEEVENAKGKLVWQPKKDAKEIAEEIIATQRS